MIVRDDSERGILPLVVHQPPSTQTDVSVSRGQMMHISGQTILLYAELLITLGWLGSEQWRYPSPPQTLPLPVVRAALLPLTAAGETAPKNPPSTVKLSASAAPIVDSSTLPPLRCSTHVHASLPEKRGIVLNGEAWPEGDSPLPNPVVKQIQQDATIPNFSGTTFTLVALDDWPGEKTDEEPKGE